MGKIILEFIHQRHNEGLTIQWHMYSCTWCFHQSRTDYKYRHSNMDYLRMDLPHQ